MAHPIMKFRGNRTALYERNSGAGLVGKVVGPSASGKWFVITSASYDAEGDRTSAIAERIESPETVLNRQVAQDG